MRNKLFAFFGLALLISGPASAEPFNFWILNGSGSTGTYSLVHGIGERSGEPYKNFNDGQGFMGDLYTDGMSTLGFGDQWLTLDTGMDFVLHELTMFLDGAYELNEIDGVAGYMVYTIYDGETVAYAGTFEFTADGYTALFNGSGMTDGSFYAALWGGDGENYLGIDFVFDGTSKVPEPRTLLLMSLGLLGLGISRRRKSANG